jgi:hypothetical protein
MTLPPMASAAPAAAEEPERHPPALVHGLAQRGAGEPGVMTFAQPGGAKGR